MKSYKDFSVEIAQKVGSLIKKNFILDMEKTWKDDNTPLTPTDIAVNNLVIEDITSQFPNHDILGEEVSKLTGKEYVWVCDPLDGTIPFSHGYPTFTFSLALTQNGESVLGVIYDPILDRMFYAEKEKGSYMNGKKIHVSRTKNINNRTFINIDSKETSLLREQLWNKRCYVTSIYSATYVSALVACGEFEAEVYQLTKPWDGAAVKVIVEEAGGEVTDLKGNEQRYDRKIHGFVASNGFIHSELLEYYRAAANP